ncbi:hypothetical protein D3C72_1915520 [compost metagenome]
MLAVLFSSPTDCMPWLTSGANVFKRLAPPSIRRLASGGMKPLAAFFALVLLPPQKLHKAPQASSIAAVGSSRILPCADAQS